MDESKVSSPINWPQILLLVAVAANLFWLPAVLKSSRPQEHAAFEAKGNEPRVDARLWQDPFEATARLRTNSDLPHLASVVSNSSTLLVFSVTGNPYTEGTEWRVRARYAALAGLAAAGYLPNDSEHLRLAEGHDTKKFPFERFTRADSSLVLLWVRDEDFAKDPLATLRNLQRDVAGGSANQLKIKVIGPWSSTVLGDLWKTASAGCEPDCGLTNPIEMYCAVATGADHMFDPNIAVRTADTNAPPRSALAGQLAHHGVEFHNVTCTDDQLARVLIEELQWRGIDLVHSNASVVLISEWDTDYGRWLPDTFEHVLAGIAAKNGITRANTGKVMRYSYLRGIDGVTVGDTTRAGNEEKQASGKEGADKQMQAEAAARPEGHSQLDYIPRVVQRIKQDSLNGQNVMAIGILGSDVYDKLLLLQSLRDSFSGMVFFTTDLDARLAHPRELKWSRNLIVASSFGLQLTNRYQGGIPPFRDTYQTAQFLACLAAVGTNDLRPHFTNALAPVVFEIGQRGPHQLRRPVLSEDNSLHPAAYDPMEALKHLGPWIIFLFITALILLGASGPQARDFLLTPFWGLTVLFTKRNWARVLPQPVNLREAVFYGSACLLAWAVALTSVVALWLELNSARGEPLTFTEGISVWPTELLRVIIVFLCVAFLFHGWSSLKKNWINELAERFDAPSKMPEFSGPGCLCCQCARHWVKRLWHFRLDEIGVAFWRPKPGANTVVSQLPLHSNLASCVPPQMPHGKLDAGELLLEYGLRTRPLARLCRFVPIALLYFAFGFSLFKLFGFPSRPWRGEIAHRFDSLALGLSVAGFILLLFFVVDATRLCARAIELMTESKIEWGQTLERYASNRAIPAVYLGEWLNIQFIGQTTAPVVRLIYFPFIILMVMIVSRNHYFDCWDWPVSLLLMLGCNSAYAIYCALYLRHAAEKARAKALGAMQEMLSRIAAGNIAVGWRVDAEALREQIKMLIDEIQHTRQGAFVSLARHPVVGAIFMPFGGAGILALLEYLATH